MSAFPPNISYRELTIHDYGTLRILGSQCLPLPYPDTYWLNIATDSDNHYSLGKLTFANIIRNCNGRFFLMLSGAYNQDNKLVGAIGVVRNVKDYFAMNYMHPEERKLVYNYKKTCYITTLIVAAEYRKIGIATQLLQRASTVLLQEGSHLIYLHVLHSNYPAIRLYEKMGYQKFCEIPGYYTINGVQETGYVYCRRLAEPFCHQCVSGCSIS
ncbi:hypothetical protein Q1695_012138 [Nippostrongylus brasiliensis]|nr:hypothetical protein Q1695_012138 [Nippostrongylus brasiliensis]